MNFSTGEISLDSLRRVLVRLEDTILFCLIERAQFAHNAAIYADPHPGLPCSFMRFLLKEIESSHAKVRRYQSPDEHPFTPLSELPQPILPGLPYPRYLDAESVGVNANDSIMDHYLHDIVPLICPGGDDGNYGSSAVQDVECLQALSRRVHYGKFIAEAKYREGGYDELIACGDTAGILVKLTNVDVERRLLARLRRKALTYGTDVSDPVPASAVSPLKIDVEAVVGLYERIVIPLTKQVEVDYLMGKRGKIRHPEQLELARIDMSKLVVRDESEIARLCKAAREIGFFKLHATSIDSSGLFQMGADFFNKPLPDKSKWETTTGAHGYSANELLDGRNMDPKEAFNFRFPLVKLPDTFENRRADLTEFAAQCHAAGVIVLECLGIGLNSDPNVFACEHAFDRPSSSTLRVLHYHKSQMEIVGGEHSDYGTLTLLFQNGVGGLEVLSDNKWLPVPPVYDEVIVNIGDILQFWTDSFYISTRHRVRSTQRERASIAYFLHPDDGAPLDIIAGHGKDDDRRRRERERMRLLAGGKVFANAAEYLKHRLSVTH